MSEHDAPRHQRRPEFLYRLTSWAVLRTPLLQASWAARAQDVDAALAEPEVVRALAVGCPDLLDSLTRETTRGRDLDRARTSLARYLVRMSTRPTPFGTFGAVSMVGWSEGEQAWDVESVDMTSANRTRTRPDMGWLVSLLRDLESDAVARAAAVWRSHPLATEHDGWLTVLGDQASVRATQPARQVLDLARKPVPYERLRAEAISVTGGTERQVDDLLEDMWRHRLLTTDIRPTLSGRDTAERCVELVRRTRPELAESLVELQVRLSEFDAAAPGEAPDRLRAARRRALEIHPVQETAFQTDLARDLLGFAGLPREVGREALRAAELLLAMTPSPQGSNGLNQYRRQFSARYGPQAEVPLLEVLDPVIGLGPMPHDHGANAPHDQRRSDVLMSLALTALRDGRREVQLEDADLAALRTTRPAPGTVPVSLELSAFLVAGSLGELRSGNFRLVLGPNLGAPSAGRSLGRFADLLGPQAETALVELAADEGACAAAEPVEVLYMPPHARSANVAVRPVTTSRQIVLDCAAGGAEGGDLEWDDLCLRLDGDRLVLRSESLQRDVLPTARHMLNAHLAPNACQLLDELSRSGLSTLSAFDWGPAGTLPVLPRVSSGRVVLAPARWLFRSTIAGQGRDRAGELPSFRSELAAWRALWDPPQRLYVTSNDNRLLLDLELPEDVVQLHREAARNPGAAMVLEEALPDVADAWLTGPDGGYVVEVVVPMLRASHAPLAASSGDASSARVARAAEPVANGATTRDRVRVPGSDWLFLKLYGPREGEDELLTGVLADLTEMTDGSGLAERWFFLRYADPEPHLRVRWQGAPDVLLGHVLPQVSEIAASLIERGMLQRLVVDTYERELSRYGGPSGTALCEQVFHADSRAVMRLLTDRYQDGLDLTEVAVLSVDRLLAALGLGEEARLAMYGNQVGMSDDPALGRAGGEDYRKRKGRLRELLSANGLSRLAPAGAVAAALSDRDAQVRAAADALARTPGVQMDRLCPSLTHMHLNRLNGGLGSPSEMHVYHLLERTRRGLALSARPASQVAR